MKQPELKCSFCQIIVLGLFPFCIAFISTDASHAANTDLSRVQLFSGADEEFQADIPLHQANWKLAMDRALEYVKNGDLAEAIKMVEIARNEARQTDANDPRMAETEKLAADIYAAQNDSISAERAYRRSVYLFERAKSRDKGEFAAALNSYAQFLKRANRIREASKFETRANSLQSDDSSQSGVERAL